MRSSYYIVAQWDPDVGAWFSESDVPGLVLEAKTLAEFEAELMYWVPILLSENNESEPKTVPIRYSTSKTIEFKVA